MTHLTTQKRRHWWYKALSLSSALALMLGEFSTVPSMARAESPAAPLAISEKQSCLNAPALFSASLGERKLDRTLAAGRDWVQFSVQAGKRYRLAAQGQSGLQLSLFDGCSAEASMLELHGDQIEFTAQSDAVYYLRSAASQINAAGAASYSVSLSPAAPHRPSVAPLATVPEAVQRRAAEFLDELRGSDLAPAWQNARINNNARILYRPDMQTPAYYEFTVEKPVDQGFEPSGFIQLAAGEHDYPVTHWDVTGLSPTQEIEDIAPLNDVQLTQFYKLDGLSYAAEYEQITPLRITTVATDVINVGDLPGRIEGLSSLTPEAAELQGDSVGEDGVVTHEGPEELPLSDQADWDSWEALKAGYKAEYAPLLASLQDRASEAWTLENGLKQHGESLIKADVRTINGLPSQTISAITVSGEGAAAQFLQQEQLAANGTITGIKLTVLAEPQDLQARLPVDVVLQYAGGLSETVKYAIVNGGALVSNRVYLPVISGGSGSEQVRVAEQSETAGDWGPWSYWWADGNAGSLRYGQVDVNGCASGCGGTAWAMLFGWVDQRAAVNAAPFANHDGIYRQGGGTGADVVAPDFQDAGVQAMTLDIRAQIGTFCIFGSGATWPWRMIDASNYVRPRASAGWRMNTKYDPTGACWFGACDGARSLARDAIQNRRQPAIVGTGWLKHYPLAYGYAERSRRSCFLFFCSTDYSRWFYVNNGWYGNNNGWTSADVWFGGTYYAN